MKTTSKRQRHRKSVARFAAVCARTTTTTGAGSVGVELDTVTCADALTMARSMPSNSVHCIVTSPPYFGLRNYGVEGQIGLEETPQAHIDTLVTLFRELRRVLRDDGTLWLNYGDAYAGSGKGPTGHNGVGNQEARQGFHSPKVVIPDGFKPKDLMMLPHRLAIALQADGWYVRADIVWSKPNPMPESVRDRPTKAHEYVFLLTKSPRYYYDADAIKEPAVNGDPTSPRGSKGVIGQQNRGNRKEFRGGGVGGLWQTKSPAWCGAVGLLGVIVAPFALRFHPLRARAFALAAAWLALRPFDPLRFDELLEHLLKRGGLVDVCFLKRLPEGLSLFQRHRFGNAGAGIT